MYGKAHAHCQMQGLYEIEKAQGKVHPSRPARGQCSRIGVWGSEPTYTCLMHNPLCAKGMFIYYMKYVSQLNVHDSRSGDTMITPFCS